MIVWIEFINLAINLLWEKRMLALVSKEKEVEIPAEGIWKFRVLGIRGQQIVSDPLLDCGSAERTRQSSSPESSSLLPFPVLLLIVSQMVTSPGPPRALALGLSISLKVGAGHFVLPKPIIGNVNTSLTSLPDAPDQKFSTE